MGSVNLSFADKIPASFHLAYFKCLGVVQAYIALGVPLELIFVKSVEVPSGLVQKDTSWCQTVEDVRGFKLGNVLQKTAFFITIYNLDYLFADGAKMDE